MSKSETTINSGFWGEISTPILALAPMYDVTDAAFRRVITKYSSPDVVFTEFANVDGLTHPVGKEKLMPHLWFRKSEGNVVAQIWGKEPENYTRVAAMCVAMGFSGVDINMGCPEKSAEKQDACAKLILLPDRAKEIIDATVRGTGGKIPVSVKTRIGYDHEDIDTWIPFLLSCDIAALTVHLRTRKEMSNVSAHWELMARIVAHRDAIAPQIKIVGNGDVTTVEEAHKKCKDTGCDGVMIGRGIFGNPWLFRDETYTPSVREKLTVMLEHTDIFWELFEGHKNFAIMKKHYKAYANGFDGAATLRATIMELNSPREVRDATERFMKDNNIT